MPDLIRITYRDDLNRFDLMTLEDRTIAKNITLEEITRHLKFVINDVISEDASGIHLRAFLTHWEEKYHNFWWSKFGITIGAFPLYGQIKTYICNDGPFWIWKDGDPFKVNRIKWPKGYLTIKRSWGRMGAIHNILLFRKNPFEQKEKYKKE